MSLTQEELEKLKEIFLQYHPKIRLYAYLMYIIDFRKTTDDFYMDIESYEKMCSIILTQQAENKSQSEKIRELEKVIEETR